MVTDFSLSQSRNAVAAMEDTGCPSSSPGMTASVHLLSAFVISTVPSAKSLYSKMPSVFAEEKEGIIPQSSAIIRIMVVSFFMNGVPFLFRQPSASGTAVYSFRTHCIMVCNTAG